MEEIEYFPWVNDKYENVEISKCGRVKQDGALKTIHPMVKTGYRMIQLRDKDNIWRLEYQHRMLGKCFIPNPNNYKVIDHIDRNKSNNSLDNLRWVPQSLNLLNTKLYKNNKTGYKGVRNYGNNKFKAIYRNNYLGIFNTAQEAHQAYLNALHTEHPDFQV